MFDGELVLRYVGGLAADAGLSDEALLGLGRNGDADGFGLTPLALRLSAYANGVSELHGEVAREMWAGLWPGAEPPIGHVTNGVHLDTWLAPELHELLRSVGVRPEAPPADGELGGGPRARSRGAVARAQRAQRASRPSLRDRRESPHHRIRTAVRHLQTGRARVLRPRTAAGAAGADRRRRQGPPPGRTRQGRHAAHRRAVSRPCRLRTGRVSRELQHRTRTGDHSRLRHLAEHAAQAVRGVGNERHESGRQRRAEPVGAGRLVGRGVRPVGRLGPPAASPTRPTAPSCTACSRNRSCRGSRTVPPGSS